MNDIIVVNFLLHVVVRAIIINVVPVLVSGTPIKLRGDSGGNSYSKTYVYDNVLAAKVEPCGVIPKQAEICQCLCS
jgi:hypothetical protein